MSQGPIKNLLGPKRPFRDLLKLQNCPNCILFGKKAVLSFQSQKIENFYDIFCLPALFEIIFVCKLKGKNNIT